MNVLLWQSGVAQNILSSTKDYLLYTATKKDYENNDTEYNLNSPKLNEDKNTTKSESVTKSNSEVRVEYTINGNKVSPIQPSPNAYEYSNSEIQNEFDYSNKEFEDAKKKAQEDFDKKVEENKKAFEEYKKQSEADFEKAKQDQQDYLDEWKTQNGF